MHALRLFNTQTRGTAFFAASDPARVTFYTCGPTVYDDAHIGNFRSFLAADVLRRWIESPLCVIHDRAGKPHANPTGTRRVVHVMNITDVGHMTDDAEGGERGEDRMAVAGRRLLEAKKAGKLPADASVDPADPYQIARFYESRFVEDARTLGLKLAEEAQADPTLMPRATQSVLPTEKSPGMIGVIERLIAGGFAYVTGPPGLRVVYFDVQRFPAYGSLSGNTLEKLREGEGGRVLAANQASKKHPADFLLWKEDPTHIMKWPSPWGEGYPGWHIECTVMSSTRLAPGKTTDPIIDLHSGGEDNIFPHHECEIAQSCCAFTGARGTFAGHWFHPRFLFVEGAKMSKSKGNFFTPRDLFARGVEPAALRLELVRTHYRSNANFTLQGLADCQKMVDRWRRFLAEGEASQDAAPARASEAARDQFAQAMHDDLNVAKAVAAINSWVGAVENPTRGDAAVLRQLDATLGVLERQPPKARETEIGVFADGLAPDAAVEALLRQRRDARAAKNFAASDAIRDQLAAMGYAVKDVAGGKVEVRRKQ